MRSTDSAGHARLATATPLAALFIAALALRPQLVGVGPLLPTIQQSLGLSHGVAGLLSTLPVLCMALFAVPAVRLAHRVGLRAAMTAALTVILLFGLLRPIWADATWLFLTTAGIGLGIGVGGALLPRAVKAAAPDRAGYATGVYTAGIQIGSAAAAVVAAPIALLLGWQAALLILALATAPILVAWLVVGRRIPPRVPDESIPHLPFRRAIAWRLVALFSLNSLCFYGLNTWLPSVYVDLGWTQPNAGALVGIMNAAGLPACLAIPWISDRSAHRNGYVIACGVATAFGIGGILLAPALAIGWVIIVGLALGALFPLTLTLPVDAGRQQSEVAGYAAMMLTGGYAVAAVGPVALGAMRDATGSFDLSLWVLVAAAVLLAALGARRLNPPSAHA